MNAGTRTSIRTRLEQLEVLPGHPRTNTDRILARIQQAGADGIELLVFPEMAVPGYLLGDEWEHEAFLRECEACGETLRAAADTLTLVFGNVGIDWQRRNEDGRVRKYNAAFVVDRGRFVGPEGSPYPFVIKALLPNYREFDDSRHFSDLRKLATEQGKPVEELLAPVPTHLGSLGCLICEDAWDADYALTPLAILARRDTDLFINISSSPYTLDKNHKRNRVFAAHAAALKRPLVYVNNVGIQNNGKTVFTFEGESCIYDAHGHWLPCGQAFEESSLTHDIPLDPGAAFGTVRERQHDAVEDLHRALCYGIERFMTLCGVERVTVGISGGIDSAVVAALYRSLLPPDRLLLVNMPGPFTSNTTRRLAAELAENLDCLYAEVPIAPGVDAAVGQLDGLPLTRAGRGVTATLTLGGLARENIQARDRSARILAAVAAGFGGVFTCNANKSEATVGYTTLYGDLAGYLACIADLWKTEVYALARHMNAAAAGPLIPSGCLDVVPSAELSAEQDVDRGRGDPLVYAYHDLLFKSWVEWWNRATPEEILEWYAGGELEARLGYEGRVDELFEGPAAFVADLERWWNLYQGMGLVKRIQAPPVLAVKRRAFGFDHREAQMGPRYTQRYLDLKGEVLA